MRTSVSIMIAVPAPAPVAHFLADRAARGKPAFPWPSHALNTRATLDPSRVQRRGGRVVECTALEMRHTGNRIGGSNPSLSATSERSVPDTWVTVYSGDMGNTFGPKGFSIGSSLHVWWSK